MKLIRRTTILASLVLLSISTAAVAAGQETREVDNNRRGAYFGIGIAHAWPSFGDQIGDNDGNWHSGLGLNARGGYRFNRYLAAEGNLDFTNRFKAKENIGGSTLRNAIRTTSSTVNAKAILPLDWIQPYAMGGIGFQAATLQEHVGNVRSKETNYNFVGRLAIGIDIMLHKNLGWHVEAAGILPSGGSFGTDDNLNMVILNTGFRYVF